MAHFYVVHEFLMRNKWSNLISLSRCFDIETHIEFWPETSIRFIPNPVAINFWSFPYSAYLFYSSKNYMRTETSFQRTETSTYFRFCQRCFRGKLLSKKGLELKMFPVVLQLLKIIQQHWLILVKKRWFSLCFAHKICFKFMTHFL